MRRPIGCWLPVCLKPSVVGGGVLLCGFADGLYFFENSELTAVGFLTAVFFIADGADFTEGRGTLPIHPPETTFFESMRCF